MGLTSSQILASFTLCWVPTFAAVTVNDSGAAISQKTSTSFIDPRSFAVLNPNGPFRNDPFAQTFNPTSTTPPFFQIFDPAFLNILGPNPSFHIVASNETFAFAHEAPIFVPELDEVFFASNDGGPLGNSDLNHNNKVGKFSMKEVEKVLYTLKLGDEGKAFQIPVTEVRGISSSTAKRDIAADINAYTLQLVLPDTIQMTNGGTGPFKSSLVLINSGRGPLPPSIALVNPIAPHNATVLLDNFFGRQFNSLNDIKIHPKSGVFFFTDATYGSLLAFRPPPIFPNQVYRFDPATGEIRVVATDFNKCNGLAFSADGKTAYVTDTGANGGLQGNYLMTPATIYKFDVDPEAQVFMNRRVFAYVDTGIPDGVQIDAAGNVYTGCGDGVQVFSPSGTLLGKFFIGSVSANMVFAGDGRLVIMGETKLLVAKIAAKAIKLSFP